MWLSTPWLLGCAAVSGVRNTALATGSSSRWTPTGCGIAPRCGNWWPGFTAPRPDVAAVAGAVLVLYEALAVAFTDVPVRFLQLARQRPRWARNDRRTAVRSAVAAARPMVRALVVVSLLVPIDTPRNCSAAAGSRPGGSVVGDRHLVATGHRLAGQNVAVVEVLLLEHLVVHQVDLAAQQSQRARAAVPLPAGERRVQAGLDDHVEQALAGRPRQPVLLAVDLHLEGGVHG